MLPTLAAMALPLHSQADDVPGFEDAVNAANDGKYALAVERFSAIVKKDPKARESFRRLAWILATCPDAAVRDGKRAIKLAETCSKLTTETFVDENGIRRFRVYVLIGGYPIPMDSEILAAAHAEAGHFGQAVLLQKKALKDREKFKDREDREKKGTPKPPTVDTDKLARERLAVYEAGQAFHTK